MEVSSLKVRLKTFIFTILLNSYDMKRFAFVILVACLVYSCSTSVKEDQKGNNNSRIEFASISYDYGKIAYESDGRCTFTFTNTSGHPLIINAVRTSCGCTDPEWPKEPVEPGKSGEIHVKYNTMIPGSFQKSITVFSNAVNSPVKLVIKGEVLPDPAVASSSSKNE